MGNDPVHLLTAGFVAVVLDGSKNARPRKLPDERFWATFLRRSIAPENAARISGTCPTTSSLIDKTGGRVEGTANVLQYNHRAGL